MICMNRDDGPTKTPVPIQGISQLAIFDHQPRRLLQEETEENGYKLTENLLTVYKPAKDAVRFAVRNAGPSGRGLGMENWCRDYPRVELASAGCKSDKTRSWMFF